MSAQTLTIDKSEAAEGAWARLGGKIRWHWERLPERFVEAGLPPAWLGYRWVAKETVPEYFARTAGRKNAGAYETLQPVAVARNPLPCNITDRSVLPADRGWWGYSFHDVPERISGETFKATLPNCRLVFYNDSYMNNFYPAILNRDDRALSMREVAFRPRHGEAMRAGGKPVRLKKATWILERVYHNHSHWLTAHLPKLCLLKRRGELGDLVLPRRRNAVIDTSLRMLGIDPDDHFTFDAERPLEVDELTLLGTDRFRPELVRSVREDLVGELSKPGHRRVFISRAKSRGRRLVNEDELWPILEGYGFERVFMEELSFEEQIDLMRETEILLAPHGAGLTNMMFCAPGTHIIEIADLGFPNPNFYALASAMGLHYWLIEGDGLGECHPLEKDLGVAPEAVREVLDRIGL